MAYDLVKILKPAIIQPNFIQVHATLAVLTWFRDFQQGEGRPSKEPHFIFDCSPTKQTFVTDCLSTSYLII